MRKPARARRVIAWVPGALAASCLFACSLQDFSYLTRDLGDVDSGDVADAAAAPSTDATARDAAPEVGSSAADASQANDVAVVDADGAVFVDAGAVGPGSSTLVNPSFEQGYSGWTFIPATAMGKYAYTQYPPTGGYTIDGQYELATWSATDSFTVSISQTLSNLPSGTYFFQGHFNCGVNNAAYVFSTNCGGPDQRANIPPTAATAWETISITIDVTGGSCEVGFYVDASPTDWLNADAFTFGMVAPADGGGE